ncbi:MAG: class I SAM-dependent methyltransferase [Thermoplasmata archaeon]|nr:class I SAM-dependent methyltransferase [Thermoplasmata archaeon]
MSESSYRALLDALEVPAAARDCLAAYLNLLAAWSRRTNLTGARTPASRVEVLVAAVLPALPFLEPGRLLDVGSGNGSPGLVLALARPEHPATLLEPRGRRWAFLREAARAAGRPDIEVLRLRHDQYRGPAAENVTIRGLALPLEELADLGAGGARLLVFGGDPQPGPSWVQETQTDLPRSILRVFRRPRST